jgi:uncharacterized protein
MKNYALITGASSGIGLAMAEIFAHHTTNLVLVARSIATLKKIKSDLEKKYGIVVHILKKDLAREESPKEIYDFTIDKNIHIEYLVNNAWFWDYGPFVDSELQRDQDMIQVNIGALTMLTRYFIESMKKHSSGKILNVASTAAFQPWPYMAVYFASKAYVSSFWLALSKEVEKYGITVTTLYPGPTQSNFAKNAKASSVKIFGWKLPTSHQVAQFAYEHMMKGKKIAIHGFANRLLAWITKFLPMNILLNMMELALKK